MKRKLTQLSSAYVSCGKQSLLFFIFFQLTVLTSLYAQNTEVSGVVKDAKGSPMDGVSVNVKGTKVGALTDSSGHYVINVPANATLVFSFVGYASAEQPVKGRSTIDVTLNAASSNLDEVVVIGYGTRKRQDVTGAVAKADLQLQKQSPNSNVMSSLRGAPCPALR